ncbi:MAG: aminotransferase class I/II-fold pyridoxal phosphate-dependent enzyme, partial [Planctomycetota bacterium]
LLVTESVFSMDGDIAPLKELSAVCDKYDSGLVVDEAHATGIYGQSGGGLTEELSLQQNVLCKLGTLSKAIGGVGGFVSGSESCVRYLINHCRSYIFSTAPSPTVMQGVLAALQLLPDLEQERLQLRIASRQLRAELEQQGWQCSVQDSPATATEADSPIIPVVVGSAERALRLSRQLLEEKIYVPAIRPPTVPEGSCRLRLSLSVKHSQQDIAKLTSFMASLADA